MKCWGSGFRGQLGNGRDGYLDSERTNGYGSSVPVDVHKSRYNSTPLKGIIQISSSIGTSTCALTQSGQVKCWGYSYGNAPVYVLVSEDNQTPLRGITQISSIGSDTCALTQSGQVKCWSSDRAKEKYPVYVMTEVDDNRVPLSNIAQLHSESSCAITHSGDTKCWSSSYFTDNNFSRSGIIQISGGGRACALTDEGSVMCLVFDFWKAQHHPFDNKAKHMVIDSNDNNPLIAGTYQREFSCSIGDGQCSLNDINLSSQTKPISNSNSFNLEVSGIKPGETLSIHRNPECTSLIGSSLSSDGVLDINGLVEGTHRFYFSVNNKCSKNYFTYTVDSTPPPSPIISFIDKRLMPNPEVEVSNLDIGDTVKIYVSENNIPCEVEIGSEDYVQSSTVKISSIEVLDNASSNYKFYAKSFDSVGNESSCSDTSMLDLISPSTPVISSVDLNTGSGPGLKFLEVEVSNLDIGDTIRIYASNNNIPCELEIGSEHYVLSPTVKISTRKSLVGNSYKFYAKSFDSTGNESSCSDPSEVYNLSFERGIGTSGGGNAGKFIIINIHSQETMGVVLNVDTSKGRPRIPFFLDGKSQRYAYYQSGSGGQRLTFRYQIVNGDNDRDGIEISSSIDLNGGSIRDSAGSNVLFPTFHSGISTGVRVDTVSPFVTGLHIANEGYISNLDIEVEFNEGIQVQGVPRIALTIGSSTKYAEYYSGSGSSNLTFRYIVVDDDNDTDGIQMANVIDLNGGSIDDLFGNVFSLTLPSSSNLSEIFLGKPYITNTQIPPKNYLKDEHIDISVEFNESVINVDTTGGTPRIVLTIGTSTKYASYHSGSGGPALIFRYTISAGDHDDDGITIGPSIDLNGGAISDNTASASLNLGDLSNLKNIFVNNTYTHLLSTRVC